MKTKDAKDLNKKIGAILKEQRKALGYTCADVSKILSTYGLSCKLNTINSWENGLTNISGVQFIILCKIYNIKNINALFLDDNDDNSLNSEGMAKLEDYRNLLVASGLYKKSTKNNVVEFPKKRYEVPMYDLAVSAGTGEFLDNDTHEMIEIPENLPKGVTKKDIQYAVHIHGDSMHPKFKDQQLIWIQKTEELTEGDIGIFYLDGDAYCKQFHITNEGLFLVSLNKEYEPIRVKETSNFKILGKVIM